MKKYTLYFILFSACFLIVESSFSQTKYGIKTGINFPKWDASVNGSNIASDRTTTFIFGGFLNNRVNDLLSLQTELLYQQKGVKLDNILYSQNYFNIPLLLSFDISPIIFFETGLQYGYLVNAKSGFGNLTNKFNKNDIQLLFGGGFVLNKKIELDIRYGKSLNNISISNSFNFIKKDINTEIRNNELSVTLKYPF